MNASGMIINSTPTKFSEFENKNNVLKSVSDGKFNFFIGIISLINIGYLWANRDKVFEIYRLIHYHKFFIPSLIIIFLWCIFVFVLKGHPFMNEKHPAVKTLEKSTHAGLFALIIALFAYIDIVIPVFWLVLLIHFIFNDPELE